MLKFVQIILLSTIFLLGSCTNRETIINRQSEALLTKNNELLFRFHINEKTLSNVNMYKVRISINNKTLANALGTDEIIYGEDSVYEGEYVDVHQNKKRFVSMKPIPLKQDLHTFEIKKLIVNKKAVMIEIFNDKEVLGKGVLSNFSSQI